jgi:Protein of unknown function DUF72
VARLAYSLLIRTPKGFVLIPNSLTQQRWTLLTFYDRFYSQMTKGTFIGMPSATPEKFQFSIKVPETITHVKRLDIDKVALVLFQQSG